MTTNSLSNECLNDFTIKGESGSTRKLRVENTNNTAGSEAAIETFVGGTSSDDNYFRYVINTATSYAHGIDNTDSQSFNISYAASALATPSSTKAIKSTTNGALLYPSQPLFKAYCKTGAVNCTGDNTVYFPHFSYEEVDQNNNFDTGTYLFTAPKAGKYLFATSVQINNVNSSHTKFDMRFYLNGSAVNDIRGGLYLNSARLLDTTNARCTGFMVEMINLAANDTIGIAIVVGTSTKTVGIPDFSATPAIHQVFFAGTLMG